MLNWKKNAALFIAGQALSFFGTMVVGHAITWHITLKTHSGQMMALFTAAAFLPMLFVSPFGGVWADRYNRKYIINISDGAVAFVSLIAALFLMAGIDSAAILLFCSIMRSLGQGVQSPAVGAFIADIVPQENLIKVNGIQNSIFSFVTLTAPMLSAAMMISVPLSTLFFLDVSTAAVGISIVAFFVKTPSKIQDVKSIKSMSYFQDVKDSLRYVKEHNYIFKLIIISAFFMFLCAPVMFLTPLQVIRNFGDSIWRLSAAEIVFSVGTMAGGILIGIWGGFKNRIYTMAFSCGLCGFLCIGLGAVGNFIAYLIVMAAGGLIIQFYNAPFMTLVQTEVDPKFLGRVLAVFSTTASAIMPLGMAVFGPLADFVSIDMLLIVTGIIIVFLCLPMLASKTLVQIGVNYLKRAAKSAQ
ncbi:MAG: MFS transporter [Elusimicrobiota bacterium]|jgi:DHA3 family macrolide efflux protein-like MFS transporter|nr:MFS transporter [Elusimicrobiota bacterium]